ncbi:hypothetical protein [Algibacter sp. R77976]|uniref:hypothetical protein n=1 Tax=Algibacter sp. R77976 TaxID=3093873 RepID=UPI0037C64542
MKPKYRKLLVLIPIILFLGYIVFDWNKVGGKSFEEAGTDFTKTFNSERKKMNLPIIPDNWTNLSRLDFKVQIWENPDQKLPSHSEKTVFATYETAEFEKEIDIYNLKRVKEKYYQIVVEFSKVENKWDCTLRETYPTPTDEKRKLLRDAGTLIAELTLEQATDTIRKYGIERLNY